MPERGGSGKVVGSGLPVDERGGPTVDPTKNVLDLVEAAVKRLDDLRIITAEKQNDEIAHVKEIGDLRDSHQQELRMVESVRLQELRAAEADRLNSIRQVDREDVNKTAAQALNAIQTLANTTNTTAETLRNQVAATAAQAASQRALDTAETNKRMSAVELALSEGKGKQQVADPQMERLTALVERLAATQSTGEGKGQGIQAVWFVVLGIVSLLGGLIGVANFFLNAK